ncbi:hypothetical protein [Microbacterium sp. YY-01]|uniref:hypothetical protein n=1 Tax=Microbacterium sp. YY-01 TaxID=3421634 RepID=UPI003D17A76A
MSSPSSFSPSSSQPPPINTHPLTAEVSRSAVRQWHKDTYPRKFSIKSVLFYLVYAFIGFMVLSQFIMLGTRVISRPSIPLIMALVVMAVVFVLFTVGRLGRSNSAYRLHHFAEANNLHYKPSLGSRDFPGMIFHIGHSRGSSDVLQGRRVRPVEIANYTYSTGSGKNETTHHWGYVAIKLNTPLPNIVLDAVGNNSLFGSNLPARFARGQRLSLEGDFNKYFQLYCPEGYERDALYLFTPDIMARFIDHASQLDAEIIDDWLFLYSSRKIVTTDPGHWEWLLGTVDALTEKFAQWERWRDERLTAQGPSMVSASPADTAHAQPQAFAAPTLQAPPPGVAKEGRRLQRSRTWITPVVVMLVAYAVFQFLTR